MKLSSHSDTSLTDRDRIMEMPRTGQMYFVPPISTSPYSITILDSAIGVVDLKSADCSRRNTAPLCGSIAISP